MSSLCVITARGGSKRIPRKNIRSFCGKPIIAYSIEAAIESGLFEEVMVSTDDKEIADLAKGYGANIPFLRSAKSSDDYATTVDVLLEVLEEYEEIGMSFDTICCLYPTAPFVSPRKLREAAEVMLSGSCAVFTMVRFSFPPQRGLVCDGGNVRYWQPEHAFARSQDLEPVFHDAGQFYFSSVEKLKKEGALVGVWATGYQIPETEAQDIDNESDWELAEMKYERMIAREQITR